MKRLFKQCRVFKTGRSLRVRKCLWPALSAAIIFLSASQVLAQSTNSLTYTTYYPVPFGSYDKLRLTPRDSAPVCLGVNEWGKVYYDNVTQNLLICEDDGAGGGQWSVNSGNIWRRDAVNENIFLRNLNDFVSIGNSTPEFRLTIVSDGGILARGNFGAGVDLTTTGRGTRFIWYPKKAALRAGEVTGSQWNDINIGNHSVAFGLNTVASGESSAVSGGRNNIASGNWSNISGGDNNQATAQYSSIGGGLSNSATGIDATIGGGELNLASGLDSTVTGGKDNRAISEGAYVGGGANNDNQVNNIAGGVGICQTIGGGSYNRATGNFAAVAGGGGFNINDGNQANGDYSFTGGGQRARADGTFSVVVGAGGLASGDYTTVVGGTASVDYATAVEGTASGIGSVVGGGAGANIASGNYATVSGGGGNDFFNNFNPNPNIASGPYSIVDGGEGNVAAGAYSYAGGQDIRLTNLASETFAWGDRHFPISTARSFLIFPGGVGGVSINTLARLHDVFRVDGRVRFRNLPILGGGPGVDYLNVSGVGGDLESDNTPSSRRYKENIRELVIKPDIILKLNPVRFTYKSSKREDIGLIAEDVNEIIPPLVRYDDKGRPNVVRYDRVAVYLLVAIKELDAENKTLEAKSAALKQRVAELEKLVGKK